MCYPAHIAPVQRPPHGECALKVLHINDYSTGGGAELHAAMTMELLGAAGVSGKFFTLNDLPDQRLTAWRYIDNAVARKALAAELDSYKPDVVHLHNFYHVLSPGILGELASYRIRGPLRVVMTAHDYHLVCPNSGGSWFRAGRPIAQPIDPDRLRSWSYLLTRRWDHRGTGHSMLKLAQHIWNYRLRDRRRQIDAVLCPSRFIERLIKPIGVPTIFVPNPAPAMQQDSSRRSGRVQLVFAGRVEPEKGINEFLQMLPGSFNGLLTVIGDGTELERCRATCARRGMNDRVEFRGRLPHAQAINIIACAHVLILPSLCLENCPMSLIEALAAGTNVLVSNVGGMREIVDAAGVGHTFTPGDAVSLSVALGKISAAHADGSLNAFDLEAFLAPRSEESYVRTLLRAYEAPGIPGAVEARAVSESLA